MTIEDIWLDFLRGTGFPRDLGFYNRIKVNSFEEMVKLIRENNGKRNIALQIYSDEQIEKGEIDTVFLDFDIKRGDDVSKGTLEECKREAEELRERFGGRLYFSGYKGFHLYIDIPPVVLNKNLSRVLREWVSRNIASEYLDLSSVGDKRRIARVPYTMHMESGAYMVPVRAGDSLNDVLFRAISGGEVDSVGVVRNKSVAEELLKIKEELDDCVQSSNNGNSNNNREGALRLLSKELPPCIREFLGELNANGELDHYKRFQVAVFLLRCGFTVEDVVKVFMKAQDFNEYKSRYQIEYFKRRDMKMFGCRKAKQMGMCPLETPELCPYYDSPNRILRLMNNE